VNVQGNEQRDAPVNRDSTNLNSSNVWIDRRNLIYVPAGTGGDPSERWYTAGGLLEVSGYLGLANHGIGEWAAQGGTVAFTGGEVVTQNGSNINLSGGTLNVQTGMIKQTWLKGTDGQLYEAGNAPADILYTGLYKGFESTHPRWGADATEYFYNPFIAPRQRLENGYTVGRDAGRMIIATGAAVLEGDVTAETYQGPQQTQKGNAALDSYNQSQKAAALGAQLILGSYTSAVNTDPNIGPLGVFHNLTPTFNDIVFTDDYTAIADTLQSGGVNEPLPQNLQGTSYIDSALLDGFNLGGILAAGKNSLTVNGALSVSPGGAIALYAPHVDVNADLTARGGSIGLGNVLSSTTGAGKTIDISLPVAAGQNAQLMVAGGVTLDAGGVWSNLLSDENNIAGLPYADGGSVSVRNTGDVTLSQGSVVDVSSGAALLKTGALRGGFGGDVTLAAGYVTDANLTPGAGLLTLGGELRAYGVNGGGTLNIQSGTAIGIGGELLNPDRLLPAGQAASANLRLLQDYQLAIGDRAPMDIWFSLTRRPAGYTVTGIALSIIPISGAPIVVQADWQTPVNVFDAQGNSHAAGSTVLTGTLIQNTFSLPVGYTIPADAFPNGLPITPVLSYYQAGAVLDIPITLAAGSTLAAGAVLQRPVGVAATATLAPSLFQSGFAHYTVTANDGIVVAPRAQIDVNMPLLRADLDALRALPTGDRLASNVPVWTPPLYLEDPLHATLTQRGGASLELDAGSRVANSSTYASLTVGAGARIAVDPGQDMTLWSNGGQVTIDGRLDAWGGNISITSLPGTLAYRASPGRSVWIGDDAVIDAAARAYVAHDAQGRAYGVAPDGGAIDIGLSDSFVVIRPGAVMDASGAYAEVDAAAGSGANTPSRPLALAGDGGSIGLHSYVGMAIDGALSAHAGGAGAAGGSLTVEMANRVYDPSQEVILQDYQTLHNLTLTQQHRPSGLAADLVPGQTDAALKYGAAALGADQVQAGGFDALTLATHDLFIFDGNIDLALGRSLNLRNGLLTVGQNTPDAQVHLAAPYIRLDGGVWTTVQGHYSPGIYQVNPAYETLGSSSLTLTADLIDIYGRVQSGIAGLRGDGDVAPNVAAPRTIVDAGGFASVALQSEGDIRFNNAAFLSAGDISIDAAQIYPASGQRGMLIAGLVTSRINDRTTWDPERSLVLRSNGRPAPIPDSVFGRLVLMAPTLDQGGVVRAPLGTISLNDFGGALYSSVWLGFNTIFTINGDMRLILRDGSLTSVSAAGLTMPYGGTSDGLTYRGADGTLYSLGANAITYAYINAQNDTDALPQGISLGGGSVVVEAGSVLDLSGGGDLRGAGFISGRGGSVDVLTTPLANANPAAYGKSGAHNAVYAIVPGYASDYAPLIADKGAGDPAVGRQITIGAGVPGLPAGTYTLLPASFALMPNAYRVEVGSQLSALAGTGPGFGAVANSSGSWATTGTLSTAGTGIRDSLPSEVLVTPGQTVRHFSQYNETGYADFAVTQAALFGNVRPMLPSDGKILRFNFMQNDNATPLQFDGVALLDPAAGGVRGQVSVLGDKPIEIVGGATQPTVGAIALSADTLSVFSASTLSIGGLYSYLDGQSSLGDSARSYFSNFLTLGDEVRVRDGATLRAGQIFLIGKQITVDDGAVLDTRGMGQPGVDSNLGFLYANNPGAANPTLAPAVLAVSNGWLDFLPSVGTGRTAVNDGATLLTEGTVAFAAPGGLALGDVNLGARYLTVSQDQINIGTAASLAAAQAAGTMQAGWQLSQDTLDRLMRPSASSGVPALQRLSLTAGGAFNFYGSVTLDTGDSPVQMVFDTPAFYGLGTGSDVVRIATHDFVWNGLTTGNGTAANPYVSVAPVAVQPGGPGTGSGALVIDAQTVTFGYDALSQPQRQAELDRLAMGFGAVTIQASDRITANNKGVLSVGQTQDVDGTLHGGALSIVTPLLTGQAGSAMRYVSGGVISVSAPQGMPAAAATIAAIGELGATLTLQGAGVVLDTAVALPSGVLKIVADGDITLGDGAQVDLSGRAVTFYDITKYSWGGDATLTSAGGNIVQAAGSRIDVSAAHNNAGSLSVDAQAGTVTLEGALAATGGGDGFLDGRFGLTENHIADADFAALNRHLNDAGFFGARSFDVKQGDLTVGGDVRAHQISIATDGGSLTVDGKIDASGAGPGSIALAASGSLALTGRAVLDAHGSTLVTDSYGAAIDASNRARISLSAIGGTVQLDTGATFDLSSPDGVARGHLDINAPRVGSTTGGASATDVTGANGPANATGGDIAIAAAGALTIRGAQSIALNGVARYDNAPVDPADANNQLINQAYLDLIDSDSRAFDTAARSNADLQSRTAGLAAYGTAYHMRPGVEIDSKTPAGNLTVNGDLDLSGYRYGPDADRNLASALYGAGEPISLVLRAGGDLNIHGSINDGFAPPPVTPDDSGWLIHQQVLLADQPAQGGTFTLPFSPDAGDVYYLFPSFFSGDGYPVVVSGSISDDTGAVYQTGDIIPGYLFGHITVAAGTELTSTTPGGADIVLNGPRSDPGRMWSVAPMLAAGSLSASIRLVSGADLAAANTRSLQTAGQLSGRGNMVLDDLHQAASTATPVETFSVVRTGTGDLDLYVGGSYQQNSLFGVYTAGTAIAAQDSAGYNAPRDTPFAAGTPTDISVLGAANGAPGSDYESTLNAQRMWFTEKGGDFTLSAQGNITGYLQPETLSVGDWLWRQGGAELGQRTAWGLNFGSYVISGGPTVAAVGLAGFAGVGALGGGNATVHAGGNIGVAGDMTRGLLAAVGGSGRVTDQGTVLQTGGGTLDVKAGGQVSGGLYVNLRGDTTMAAADVGNIVLTGFATPNSGDPRAVDPHTAYNAQRANVVNFAPGDGVLRVDTLGDLAVGEVIDPGRVGERSETQASAGAVTGSAASWFTLWTDRTALDLFSAGGNESPFGASNADPDTFRPDISNSTFIMPASLSMIAAGGSIYYATLENMGFMMPSPDGHLDLLAKGLISGDRTNSASFSSYPIGLLGTAASAMATPLHAAWRIQSFDNRSQALTLTASNYWSDGANPPDHVFTYNYQFDSSGQVNTGTGGVLFMFGPNTVTDHSMAGDGVSSHIYALTGDVMSVQIGDAPLAGTNPGQTPFTLYHASKPLRMLAGGDIVNSGGVIVQDAATDISMVAAQGDILFANFKIAGPGTLEVSAGGQIYQGAQASLTSLGAVVVGDLRPGADIAVQASLGAGLPGQGASDFAGFAQRYLDPANVIDASKALADQPGKAVKTYDVELAQWLHDRFGYTATSPADGLAYFDALAPEQQRIFDRQVYYAELTAGGREFNDPDSKRFGSYLRGRDAIAALFPEQDTDGNAIDRQGDLTLFQGVSSNAGIRTIAGGDIQILTPGGKTVIGVEAITPGSGNNVSPAGLITQGDGDIDIYSEGSILLGLSRVMTTFGGNILGWSAEGDINAGRGSKTTIVYTPPKREYDTFGNVKLSPNVPSSGSGIATLAPIPEVPAGDVDLIAPLGTIDAGEAGIRVSGNVNLAALQVVNAANIDVKGKATGIPLLASVNVGALANAGAAATQAAMAAQDVVGRERTAARQSLPSIFSVRVLGFGNDPVGGEKPASSASPAAQQSKADRYDPSNPVQILSLGGNVDPAMSARLTAAERRGLQQDR
jgi:hypothetical protein